MSNDTRSDQDPTQILDTYYQGGLLAAPPSEQLRNALRSYLDLFLDFQNMANEANECDDRAFRERALMELVCGVPNLLARQQLYMSILCQALSEGAVVNALKSLGFEMSAAKEYPFHTFGDFLKGTQDSPPEA